MNWKFQSFFEQPPLQERNVRGGDEATMPTSF